MRRDTLPSRPRLRILFLILGQIACVEALAQDDGYVLFFDEYQFGDFYVARLGDVDRPAPRMIRPRKLRLPSEYESGFEIGNADVASDGRTIVFGGRFTSDEDWGIYRGTINLGRRRIEGVEPWIQHAGVREEDPRFSWTGYQIVYKCDFDICTFPDDYGNPVVASPCELWAPSFDLSGFRISYAERCVGAESDLIWQHDLPLGPRSQIPNAGDGPDRFAHFLADGRIVYSHTRPVGANRQESSLWVFDSGSVSLLHDATESDDDAYPDRRNPDHIAFIGWQDGRYNLFIYRDSRRDSVRLTRGISVIGPVLFR